MENVRERDIEQESEYRWIEWMSVCNGDGVCVRVPSKNFIILLRHIDVNFWKKK